MKFHYADKEAARNVLQGRVEKAEKSVTSARAKLVMAKQHLEVTPDSWRYAFKIGDPHSKAQWAVYDADTEWQWAETRLRTAKRNLKVFDDMVGWETIVLEAEG
jgi:hypothetical protein